MDKTEITALEKTRANHRIRSTCTGHLFERIGDYGQHRCRYCGATADAGFVEGYLQGIGHSRSNIKAPHARESWVRTT